MNRDFLTRCILNELVFQANKHFIVYEEDRTYLNNLNIYDNIPEFCYEVLYRVYNSNCLKKIDQVVDNFSDTSVTSIGFRPCSGCKFYDGKNCSKFECWVGDEGISQKVNCYVGEDEFKKQKKFRKQLDLIFCDGCKFYDGTQCSKYCFWKGSNGHPNNDSCWTNGTRT